MKASKLREGVSRAALVVLGLGAMSAGLAVGSSGCLGCECPELDPVEPGVFEIVGSPQRPELVGGVVDASGESVVITFVDADDNAWVIDYAIERKIGG